MDNIKEEILNALKEGNLSFDILKDFMIYSPEIKVGD